MTQTPAYAAQAADKPLGPHTVERRAPGAHDVAIDIEYCGVCHSDLHTARNEWGNTMYPSVPGHEIVGTVTAVGKDVKGFKVGDTVGVGCMVDSCGHCDSCKAGEENYCENGFTGTYNGPAQEDHGNTYGGYSANVVVDENSRCASPTRTIWPRLRRCCAPASPRIRHCATGMSAPARRPASWAWAASATWASSWRTRWARTSCCSPRLLTRLPTASASVPTRW